MENVLQCPENTGSSFFNYKGTFSIILLAVVDANYLFKYAHVGVQGKKCDGDVILPSAFYNALTSAVRNVHQPTVVPGNDTLVPYVLRIPANYVTTLSNHMLERYAKRAQKVCLITEYHEHVV